jgi:hypothetical protein
MDLVTACGKTPLLDKVLPHSIVMEYANNGDLF